MTEILISQLQLGKYYSQPVYLDDKYILLSPETPVTDDLITRLKNWKIDYVYSDGHPMDTAEETTGSAETEDIDIETVIEEGTPIGTSVEALSESQKHFLDSLNFLEKTFANYIKANTLSQIDITEHVKKIIDRVNSKRHYMLRITEFNSDSHNYIVVHSVKATILAVAIGATMRMPAYRLIELATAALMHEIGMIKLPTQIYMSNKMLNPIEKKAIMAHTVLGYKILKQNSFPMSVSLGVLECRENMDGSGYPRGLSSNKISSYGKIINVASTYAALTSKRPFRGAFNGHSSIIDMLKRKDTMYDGNIIRVLIIILSLFPLGTFVLLKNGAKGMVVETNQGNYKAPKVRILINPEGGLEKETKVVDTEATLYEIVRPLSNEEISKVKQLIG